MTPEYATWCRERGCDHAHCPEGHEHPQLRFLADGRLVCGRCFADGAIVEATPCGEQCG